LYPPRPSSGSSSPYRIPRLQDSIDMTEIESIVSSQDGVASLS
jgi:hypothetical protein